MNILVVEDEIPSHELSNNYYTVLGVINIIIFELIIYHNYDK
ncbi:hypothetical protein [Clostridium pasteurianum]|nr:hypothetical protein [Clostridium pasteurianum]